MIELSCILATKNRPHFLRQALQYWHAQTACERSELIIVDDSRESHAAMAAGLPRTKYIRLEHDLPMGEKLNIGIQQACGDIIYKIDDDDFYHPSFLETACAALIGAGPDTIVASETFLVFVCGEAVVRLAAGEAWFAGGTLCFRREAWQASPFRPLGSTADAAFLEDHCALTRVTLRNPELYMLVRHGANTWQTFGRRNTPGVTEYFSTCPVYHKPLHAIVGAEHAPFYQRISREAATTANLTDQARLT